MKVSLKTVLSANGAPNESTELALILQKLNWLCCTHPQKNCSVFCSYCLSTLPDSLSSHSQLVNELQTGFQSIENKVSKEMSG